VGVTVGALEGEAVGEGVGAPAVNVGLKEGETVGALVGEAEGSGVGLEYWTTNVKADVLLLVAAVLMVTVLEAVSTDVTVVPVTMPVPETVEPATMFAVEETETVVLPAEVVLVVVV